MTIQCTITDTSTGITHFVGTVADGDMLNYLARLLDELNTLRRAADSDMSYCVDSWCDLGHSTKGRHVSTWTTQHNR